MFLETDSAPIPLKLRYQWIVIHPLYRHPPIYQHGCSSPKLLSFDPVSLAPSANLDIQMA